MGLSLAFILCLNTLASVHGGPGAPCLLMAWPGYFLMVKVDPRSNFVAWVIVFLVNSPVYFVPLSLLLWLVGKFRRGIKAP